MGKRDAKTIEELLAPWTPCPYELVLPLNVSDAGRQAALGTEHQVRAAGQNADSASTAAGRVLTGRGAQDKLSTGTGAPANPSSAAQGPASAELDPPVVVPQAAAGVPVPMVLGQQSPVGGESCGYPDCGRQDCLARTCSVVGCAGLLHHICANTHRDPRAPEHDVEYWCERWGISAGGSLCYECFSECVRRQTTADMPRP